jgi:orotidine-5'-phosphate decarboxylase
MVYPDSIETQFALAVDVGEINAAEKLVSVAAACGILTVKFGKEFIYANDLRHASTLAETYNMAWIADLKDADTENTMRGALEAFQALDTPPSALTVHIGATTLEALHKSQIQASPIKLLGVTVVSTLTDAECMRRFGKPRNFLVMERAEEASVCGLAGVVASPQEVAMLKSEEQTAGLFTLVPGTRKPAAKKDDQQNALPPAVTLLDGADMLVLGREVTDCNDPDEVLRRYFESLNGAPQNDGFRKLTTV